MKKWSLVYPGMTLAEKKGNVNTDVNIEDNQVTEVEEHVTGEAKSSPEISEQCVHLCAVCLLYLVITMISGKELVEYVLLLIIFQVSDIRSNLYKSTWFSMYN